MDTIPGKLAQAPCHKLPTPCGAHVLARALQRHGVELMFGQSLPSALYLVAPEFGIRQIAYRTENAGAAMADGYARISHKVAVVTAQNGPAAALLVAGLSEALKASVPIVAIVQDVRRTQTDKNAFQELDHFDLFRGCSKWVRRVSQMSRIDDYVDMAFVAAASGRPGPAVLLCPQDLLLEPTEARAGDVRRENLGRCPLDRSLADPACIEKAAQLLANAAHPLLVAGGGVHLSDAHGELAHLQEAAGIPVATTSMGKGAVNERHPLSVGVIGYFMGTRGVARHLRGLVDEADVILLIGNRTNQNGTDSWTLFPPTAKYIHIDIDSQEIGRNYEALRLAGDAKLTLAALDAALVRQDLSKRRAGRAAVEQRIAAARRSFTAEAQTVMHSDAVPIRPERLMLELGKVLQPDSVVVSDASYAPIWAANYLTAQRAGMRFLAGRGLAGLGWGLPAAIGAKLAVAEREVFCITGDGGFAHVWPELETARRLDIKVIVIVLNNQILAYQSHAEDVLYGNHTDACALGPVDHAAIARACGCEGVRVEKPAGFQPALEQAMRAKVTTVIDAIIDPKAYPPLTLFEGKMHV
ncbi:MAG: acetolactate synthase catalytic subunit [Betaproteobacteria bacterium]|nr:acetolactate synthase catalytic subunit [Betaproteobacteria bacterium]MBI3052630.1 acetolactate synthase catalytic subunit [Betaproteobacteria bacterium]